MIEEYSKELLRSGIIEARAGNKESARRYLDRAIYMAAAHDVLAEAWYWMSQVIDGPAEQRKALENCLALNLQHTRARRALAILEGKLKPDEVVDPDHLPAAPDGLRNSDAQRFMCPKCGGRMSFSPDGQSLVCEYCTRDQKLGVNAPTAAEKDFIIAMATVRGHGQPLQQQVFHCNGCGAEFLLAPNQISSLCVYCDSPHVVRLENSRDLLAPDAIIPHAFDRDRATQLLVQWVEHNQIVPEKKVDAPRGLYLPLWTFDIGGAIDYTAERIESEDIGFKGRPHAKVIQVTDQYPVLVDNLPLPASRKPSAVFIKLIPTFDLSALKPYDPRYLASWPAEIYDVPMGDVSLDARSRAYARSKSELPVILGELRLIHTSSENLVVQSFKLNLLPVWMTEILFGGRARLVLINGQNGSIAADLADLEQAAKTDQSEGLMHFLADLLHD